MEAATEQVRRAEAAVEALKRQLAAKEAAARARQQAERAAREAAEHAQKAAHQVEAERRRQQLDRGLAAMAGAAEAGVEAGADGKPENGAGGPAGLTGQAAAAAAVRPADREEVARVLRAASDHDTLQLHVGCTAVEVRRAYRRLAMRLHPDKCGEEGAGEAFMRATTAYNSLLRCCGG